MMVNHAGRAMANGVSHENLCAGASIFQGKLFIQAPPQAFKNFGKVTRRFAGNSHTARKCTIKVCVRAEKSWHDQAPIGIDILGNRILLAQGTTRANSRDAILVNKNGSMFDQPVICVKRDHSSVTYKDV